MSHSPEPWFIKQIYCHHDKQERRAIWAKKPAGHTRDVIVCVEDDLYLCPEDMERIVACVNACQGIPTEVLTSDLVSLRAVLKNEPLKMIVTWDVPASATGGTHG